MELAGGVGFCLPASLVVGQLPAHGGSRLQRNTRRTLHEHRDALFSIPCCQAVPLPLQQKAVLPKKQLPLTSGVHRSGDREDPKLQLSAGPQGGLRKAPEAPA